MYTHRHTDTHTPVVSFWIIHTNNRHTDTQYRHPDSQTHRHTGHTGTQTHRHTDTQTHKHTHRHTDTQTHRHIDIQTQFCVFGGDETHT